MRVLLRILFVAALVGGTAWAVVRDRQGRLIWDHWDVVKPGILYRSGQLTGAQLEEAVKRYGIRTVVNLQFRDPTLDDERALATRLGVGFVNLPMPGDGFGEEPQFRRVLELIDDPRRRPVLVHCARGTCRTGSAVALYRFERDGWTIQDVAVEMRRQSYRDGWIPGYIFAMVKTRPSSILNRPVAIDEPNGSVLGPGKEPSDAN